MAASPDGYLLNPVPAVVCWFVCVVVSNKYGEQNNGPQPGNAESERRRPERLQPLPIGVLNTAVDGPVV